MNLSKNSFSAKLYRFFYNTDDLPNNLCPYFWQLLLAYILVIPFILPVIILRYGTDKNIDIPAAIIIGIRLVVQFALITITSMIIIPINLFTGLFNLKVIDFMITFAIIGYLIVAIIGLFFLVDKLSTLTTNSNKISIVGEFIKAKYNNYCPKIDWVDEKESDK